MSGKFQFRRYKRGCWIVLLALCSLVVLFFLSMIGPIIPKLSALFPLPFSDGSFSKLSPDASLFWGERFPRSFMAFLAGCGLSMAGLMLQTIFRNPLVDPFTLGTAGGASLGAVLCLHLFSALTIIAPLSVRGSILFLFAFAGALLALGTVRLLCGGNGLREGRMLLAGIAVNYFFSSIILCFQYIADPSQTMQIIHWTMGSIGYYNKNILLTTFFFISLPFIWYLVHSRELNLLLLGREQAAAIGVDSERRHRQLFFLSSILTAIIVSLCGPIGFVGLLVPHFSRLLVGGTHENLLPLVFFGGGIFLSVCFTISRTIIYPTILPVGIITSLLGGPFFLFLLVRNRRI